MHSSASVSKVGPCYASVAYNVVHNVAHNVAHNVVCIYTMLACVTNCYTMPSNVTNYAHRYIILLTLIQRCTLLYDVTHC